MLHRKLLAGIALCGLMTVTAMAQNTWVEVRDEVHVAAFGAIADQVEDWDVYDAAGDKIGEVEDVVGPNADTPTALAIDFDGVGGYTDRDVIISLDQFTRENLRLTLNASPDAVSSMETWND